MDDNKKKFYIHFNGRAALVFLQTPVTRRG